MATMPAHGSEAQVVAATIVTPSEPRSMPPLRPGGDVARTALGSDDLHVIADKGYCSGIEFARPGGTSPCTLDSATDKMLWPTSTTKTDYRAPRTR